MTLIYYRTDGIYIAKHDAHTNLYHSRGGDELIPYGALEGLAGEKPLKIIWINTPVKINARYPEIEARYRGRLDTVLTYPEYLEFIALGVSKAVAVEEAAKYCGISREEVLALGDGNNDIPMLEWAGLRGRNLRSRRCRTNASPFRRLQQKQSRPVMIRGAEIGYTGDSW